MTSNDQEQCAYCLKLIPSTKMTADHVIAKSWYPVDTPPVAKWKVPACGECNNRYSATNHCFSRPTFRPEKLTRNVTTPQWMSSADSRHSSVLYGYRRIGPRKRIGLGAVSI